MRVENQTKTRVWEDSSLWPETSTEKCRSRIPSLEWKAVWGWLPEERRRRWRRPPADCRLSPRGPSASSSAWWPSAWRSGRSSPSSRRWARPSSPPSRWTGRGTSTPALVLLFGKSLVVLLCEGFKESPPFSLQLRQGLASNFCSQKMQKMRD